jgi:catalase
MIMSASSSTLDRVAIKELARQIFDVMVRVPGAKPGHRPVHAKGVVCQGAFTPSKEAAALSKAAHFQAAVTITARISDGAPDPLSPDNSPGPRGMSIRFDLPAGQATDILGLSRNGFVVGTGEDFLALQKAVVATDLSKPHPWPVEEFLGSHPLALKFVQDNAVVPVSFANESFFANNAFVFVNAGGARQAGRYKILPVAGSAYLGEADAKNKPADFLVDDLKARIAAGPVKYRLVIQLPNPGDQTSDSSLVWPEDRRTIEAGVIALTSVVADSQAAEKPLIFDPTRLTDGIELSDDPLPILRAEVYSLSYEYRNRK